MTSNNHFSLKIIFIILSFTSISSLTEAQALYERNIYDKKLKPMLGKYAPDWIMQEGDFKNISDFRGDLLLLEFSGIGCGACVKAEPEIDYIDSLFRLKDLNIVIIEYVPYDKENAIIRYNASSSLERHSLIDYNDISKKYCIKAFPAFFLINRKGNIVYVKGGFNGETRDEIIEKINNLI